MGFTPIKNEKLSDKVVRAIMDQIKDGTLKPGDKLSNELDLSDELGVSRGVLREALTILQARNYIRRKPKEGTIVNPNIMDVLNRSPVIALKEGTYTDLIEMRICLEQRIVEKIIDMASDEEIDELFDLISDIENNNNTRSIDHYFHYYLAELSHNALFINFIDSYYDVIDEVTEKTTKNEHRKEEIYQEHLNIVQALKERNKEKARNAVVEHLNAVLIHVKSQK